MFHEPCVAFGHMAADWAALGATHLMVNAMWAGLQGPDDPIKAVRRIKETLGCNQSLFDGFGA